MELATSEWQAQRRREVGGEAPHVSLNPVDKLQSSQGEREGAVEEGSKGYHARSAQVPKVELSPGAKDSTMEKDMVAELVAEWTTLESLKDDRLGFYAAYGC